ncbi:hypothetical protein [Microbacterium wangruii]|uniref:hypothetical protein n=1 Tax=Microbacterium wangruii TaxID=3049073 RepID=UPI00256F0770|nr:hypothetical protein [Microbacterium sp. zg-Y1211]MDL5487930.1 hypothetical protein [Microbacterium sp. zg-Y1211]
MVPTGWWNFDGWPTPSEWSALWGLLAVVLAALAGWVAVSQLGVVVSEREERDRPHLAVDFEFRSVLVLIALRNLSGRVATNVRMTASPPIVSSHSERFSGKLGAVFGGQEKIAQLAPGRKMAWFFDRAPDRLASKSLPLRYEITVAYEDPSARRTGWFGLVRLKPTPKTYEEVFVLDLSQYGEAATEQNYDNKMWNVASRNERRLESMKKSSAQLANGVAALAEVVQEALSAQNFRRALGGESETRAVVVHETVPSDESDADGRLRSVRMRPSRVRLRASAARRRAARDR